MLAGAFMAVLGSYFVGQLGHAGCSRARCWPGCCWGCSTGVFVVKFKSDEFIIGVALNSFAGGLTVFLLRNHLRREGRRSPILPSCACPTISADSAGQRHPRDRAAAERQHPAGVCAAGCWCTVCWAVHLPHAGGLPAAGGGRTSPSALTARRARARRRMKCLASRCCAALLSGAGRARTCPWAT